jgi:hypothetical protein
MTRVISYTRQKRRLIVHMGDEKTLFVSARKVKLFKEKARQFPSIIYKRRKA